MLSARTLITFKYLRTQVPPIRLVHSQLKWQLFGAVCLQRLPKIVPDMNWLEKKFNDLLKVVEVGRSLYSDHEMRHFKDRERAERIASGQNIDDKDLDAAAKQTAQDFEDSSNLELSQFQAANRITVADETGDKKSIERCLDKHLMLLCNQRLGNQNYWLLPQAKHVDGETLRQTAERALFNAVGSQLKVKFLGNVPRSVHIYRYPKPVAETERADGGKIFFFKAIYESGEVQLNKEIVSDYHWYNRKELENLLQENYWKAIKNSLLIEEGVDLKSLMGKNRRFKKIVNKYAIAQ